MVNALLKYLLDLEKQLKSTLPGVKELDVDAVHDFRVALKKTRTVINFIHYWQYRNSDKAEIYRRFRPIFRRTGTIRELQVHAKMLPILAEQSGLELDFLSKKINYQIFRNEKVTIKEVKHFHRRIYHMYRKIRKEIENPRKRKERIDAVQGYQLKIEKRIQKQLKTIPPDLHLIRRLIKQKVYVFDAFQESELLSFYKEFRSEWKILESSMGKWHDQLVFLEWLNRGLSWKRLNDEEYTTMVKLIAWLKSSTTRMEEQLLQSVPRLKV